MRFGEDFLDEVKARVRVSDVVGKRVKLKRQGREFAGLSPFTNEKTPSFFVNDEKGFYHCFSSGKHGDGISFLMEVEGLSFPEAVEAMANMAGMAMPKADPDAERRAIRNKETINWIEAARDFYAQCLRRDVGKDARRYLVGRGLSGEDCARFGIGFAPNSFDALKNELVAKGANPKQLIEAGLLVEPEQQGKEPWDRFRNRIMFPIADPRGRLVAFGGRAMERDAKAKYLNSPETNLFHKGRSLYRYSDARREAANPQNGARGLIVAEGYMDVIALAKAGFAHAVAPLGTALTEEQLDLLWRAGPEPILCFDGDKAGLRAAFRSIERALPLLKPGHTVRFALLPDGQDPDDLIREKGAPAMKTVLERSVPMVDMLWQREVQAERLDTPEAIAGLKDRIFAALREIAHDEVREQYKTALLNRFDKEFGRPKRQSYKNGGGWNKNLPKRRVTASQIATMESVVDTARERRLIGAILEWPDIMGSVDETFFELRFQTDVCQRLQKSLLNYWRDTIAVDKRALHAHIETEGLENELRGFLRSQALTVAAMGGLEADLDDRLAIWRAEADALTGQMEDQSRAIDVKSRMADQIRNEDKDALSRLMRASRDDR